MRAASEYMCEYMPVVAGMCACLDVAEITGHSNITYPCDKKCPAND
jgi:hypothetical protein